MKTLLESSAAQAVERLLRSEDPVLSLPGKPLIQEIHDLAVRLVDVEHPGARVHLSVEPEDVVIHRRSLARAARLLERSAHRLKLQLQVKDDRSAPSLWAIRYLREIHATHPQALEFSIQGTVHPAIRRHFGLEESATGDRDEIQRALWRAILRHCRDQDSREPAETLAKILGIAGTLEQPVLFLPDRPGNWLELIATGPLDRRFGFAVGRRGGDDPDLKAVAAGGTIEIQPGQISIRRDDQQLASFFLTAFVFSLQECWDSEFWIPFALQALAPITSEPEPAPDAPVATRPEPSRETVALAEELRGRLLPPPSRAEFEVISIEPSLGRHVVITLRSISASSQQLIVLVEPLQGADKFFCEAGRLALSYSDQTPLDSPFRRRTLEYLESELARQ